MLSFCLCDENEQASSKLITKEAAKWDSFGAEW